nr:l-lysine 2,3-aminomutase [Quercus suber]
MESLIRNFLVAGRPRTPATLARRSLTSHVRSISSMNRRNAQVLATPLPDLDFDRPPTSFDQNGQLPVSTNTIASQYDIMREPYWRKIKGWEHITEKEFLSYEWQIANLVDRKSKLLEFLAKVLPSELPQAEVKDSRLMEIKTREQFLNNVDAGMTMAPMSVRLTPHVLSVANWNDPLNDPVRRQFIPLASTFVPDHPSLTLDSLHESEDSPVKATSVCPVYCRFCTRSYAVGSNTESVTKKSLLPTRKRWDAMLEHIERTPVIQDVVVSGGDSYYLNADQLRYIGERLLKLPNIKRFRFATKGLAVCPSRILDHSDGWAQAFIDISDLGRKLGKQVAMHTHFNHPNEITWVTEVAARYLFARGVTVRNQSVLLKGVNDNLETMSTLIRKLADLNIQPYYVYQSDMVKGVEDLRTPLSTILELEKHIRGTIAGFMMPTFVVDLPGGGGKRLANSFETYDKETGLSTWKAPGVSDPDETFEYHDPFPIK